MEKARSGGQGSALDRRSCSCTEHRIRRGSFGGVVPALAEHREAFLFDHLGYGQSERREGQHLSIAAQGRRFARLLQHWRLDAPSVVATDIGGAIALRALLLEDAAFADSGQSSGQTLVAPSQPQFRPPSTGSSDLREVGCWNERILGHRRVVARLAAVSVRNEQRVTGGDALSLLVQPGSGPSVRGGDRWVERATAPARLLVRASQAIGKPFAAAAGRAGFRAILVC